MGGMVISNRKVEILCIQYINVTTLSYIWTMWNGDYNLHRLDTPYIISLYKGTHLDKNQAE